MGDVFANVDLDMGGIIGAGLLSVFRVTFGDDGRFIWIEPDPMMMQAMGPPPPPPAAPTQTAPPTAAPPPAPAPKGDKS